MKIPETMSPFRVIVNGVEYVYEAGSDVTVPEAVASVIRQMSNYPPEAPKPVSPIEETDPRLPEVTASDNDKVLTVEDGVWKAKTPSGGGSSGGVIYCDLTETGEGWSASMTIEEIGEAVNSGSTVLFRWYGVVGFLKYSEEEADGNTFCISGENTLCYFCVAIDDEGVTVTEDYYTLTPAT